MPMRKFVRNIAIFLPIALLGYAMLICLLGDIKWVRSATTEMGNTSHTFSRIQDIANYHDVDILFLGSSHSYRTFDVRVYQNLGLKCFNLGSSNQTPLQTRVLLQEYLDSLNPKRIVFEVHPDIMENDGVESTVDLLLHAPLTCELSQLAWNLRNMKCVNTWIYSVYNQKIRHKFDKFQDDTVFMGCKYIPGGYVETSASLFERKRYPRRNIKIRPEQMEALEGCIKMFKERNIPYILVQVQDSKQLSSSFKNMNQFQATMANLGPFYYKELPLCDTIHFSNSNHLNLAGVDIFNEYFVGLIDSLGWVEVPVCQALEIKQ